MGSESCDEAGKDHDWEFLRHEVKNDYYGTGRLRKATAVDVFYCRRCLTYYEKLVGVQDAEAGTLTAAQSRGY